MPDKLKFSLCIAILSLTGLLGYFYVAPSGILKAKRIHNGSTPADYGMRYDKLLFTSKDDSIDLNGNIIYPYDIPYKMPPATYTLIVIHPFHANEVSTYPIIRKLSYYNFNIVTFDLRGHGQSGGNFSSLGLKESSDITAVIDMLTALHPTMQFGLWSIGNSSNVALKCIENDHRIKFAIVESLYRDPMELLKSLNNNDIAIKAGIFNTEVVGRALERQEIRLDTVMLNPSKFSAPILLIDYANQKAKFNAFSQDIDKILKHPIEVKEVTFAPSSKDPKIDNYYDTVLAYIQKYFTKALEFPPS